MPESECVHRLRVADRQLCVVEPHRAADQPHAAVEADETLAERRLAAARLAGKSHDLAVGDVEADVVERPDVPAERPVVDGQVLDREAHVSLSLGLKTSSRPTLVTYSPPTIAVMPTPGGMNHHQ